jgi:hypothetical protein
MKMDSSLHNDRSGKQGSEKSGAKEADYKG